MLYHVSEEAGIARFEPRPSSYTDYPVVWAIDERRLCNYLLPRECPRVTYYARQESTADDVERFLGASTAVVAIEKDWLERVRATRLYGYRMPADRFECLDAGAGYHVSGVPVVPSGVEVFEDLLAELQQRSVELRVLPDLWQLHHAVVSSSLHFSMIRMRNALPKMPNESTLGYKTK